MNELVTHSADWLIDQLLPRHCVACGSASGERNLCRFCLDELPRITHGCRLCGTALSLKVDTICGSCLSKRPPWHHGLAALNYEFPVSQMVCRFKFQRDLASGQILTQEMLASISRTNSPLPDCIAPVPLHRLRQFTRSFNQAEVLARGVANHLKIPLSCGWLRRVRPTTAQSGLNASERKRNIRGAFTCDPIHHRHIALVDDVLTTGTTLAECCRAVQRAGVSEVSVWVAARANIG